MSPSPRDERRSRAPTSGLKRVRFGVDKEGSTAQFPHRGEATFKAREGSKVGNCARVDDFKTGQDKTEDQDKRKTQDGRDFDLDKWTEEREFKIQRRRQAAQDRPLASDSKIKKQTKAFNANLWSEAELNTFARAVMIGGSTFAADMKAFQKLHRPQQRTRVSEALLISSGWHC